MRRLSWLAVAVGLIATRTPAGAQTHLPASGEVFKIRIYNYAHVPEQTLHAASVDSAHIFESAGSASSWQICRIRESALVPDDARCDGSLDVNEFSVRIVNGPVRTGPDVLGYSVISPDHVGVLATVLFQRILVLAERSGTDVASLLGRVMAHEVGHLVLGSSDHGWAGLMRAVWNVDPTTGFDQNSDWRFSREEAARIRRRIVGRFSP